MPDCGGSRWAHGRFSRPARKGPQGDVAEIGAKARGLTTGADASTWGIGGRDGHLRGNP